MHDHQCWLVHSFRDDTVKSPSPPPNPAKCRLEGYDSYAAQLVRDPSCTMHPFIASFDKRGAKVKLEERVARDKAAGELVRSEAQLSLYERQIVILPHNSLHGSSDARDAHDEWSANRRDSLENIAEHGFHAMMEVVTELRGAGGQVEEKAQIWYASEATTTNEVFGSGSDRHSVLAWSHPGVQIALSGALNNWRDIGSSGYRLVGLETAARARFDSIAPEVSGLYEPGGPIRPQEKIAPSVGLKAVKLSMTADQVNAFISRMTGLMVVTGAPGSGKTTVAFQRIRFLFDQQDLRSDERDTVPFTADRTKVFLANPNLVSYSRKMLVEQLDISERVVTLVDPIVKDLLDHFWTYTHEARPRQKRLTALEIQARRAYFGLCDVHMLQILWRTYEQQIADRLQEVTEALWTSVDVSKDARPLGTALAKALVACGARATAKGSPLSSNLRLDRLYRDVARPYETFRQALTATSRESFDEAFQKALFYIYDPLAALAGAFGAHRMDGGGRIARGTGHLAREAEILDALAEDWADRRYGPEEQPWLAWLLRFALSEVEEPQGQHRFRLMPGALDLTGGQAGRWTHVVLDEAQDLSVAEASLLTSFVHTDGAVTVSADFRQAVTPTKGMEDASALSVGSPLRDTRAKTTFRFGRNMRQSKQIGRFLQGFYESAFGELAPFDVNPDLSDAKPRLILATVADQPRRVVQLLNVLRRSQTMKSVAIVQINEHEESMLRLREKLVALGAELAPIWEAVSQERIITTSVERVKGLEFDACIVLGLEDVERSTLHFTVNRAYVGLSRPARRLAMVCEHTPSVLKRLNSSLYEVAAQQGTS